MKLTFYILLFLITSALELSADVTTYSFEPVKTGILFSIKSNDIVMEDDEILIDVILFTKETIYTAQEIYVQYNCRYSFMNIGPSQKVLLGFPVVYGSETFYNSHTKPESSYLEWVDDLSFFVAGKEVNPGLYIHGVNEKLDAINYDEVYETPVWIGKDETVSVEVVHSITMINPGHVDMQGSFAINYILKSVLALHGPIKKGVITARFFFHVDPSIKNADLWKITRSSTPPFTTAIWSFKNLVPKNDVEITIDSDLLY
jgi:hypothetical protein